MTCSAAVLTRWNPDTWENSVTVNGVEHVNLPVLASAPALPLKTGDAVVVIRWPSGALWLADRVVA